MNFYNFKNEQTFHFFRWIANRQFVVDNLIADGFEAAETDEYLAQGGEVCIAVRDKISDALADLIDYQACDVGAFIGPEEPTEIGDVDETAKSLWQPLLAHAFSAIDTDAVAEALLILAGKWNPDKIFPEIV